MNKFLKILLMLFVLTPLSVLQSICGFCSCLGFIFAITNNPAFDLASAIGMGCVFLVGAVILALIVRAIRDMGWLFFFFEILVSPIRVILQVISLIITFISLFNDWDIDPRDDPAYEDGFVNATLRFLLMISVDSFSFGRSFSDSYDSFFDEDRRYKIKNIFYQLVILLLTLFHSAALIYGLFGLDWIHTVLQPIINPLFTVIIYVFLYIVATALSARMKGVDSFGEYYDPEQIEERTDYYKRENTWLGPVRGRYLGSEKRIIKEAGWKSFIKLGMIVYLIMSPLWFIPQLLTFLLAIVIPAHCSMCPCRAKDADIELEDNFSGKKNLHMLTGLAHDYEIDKN